MGKPLKKLPITVLLVILFVILALSVLACTCIGPTTVSPITTTRIILSQLPFVSPFGQWTQLEYNIVMGLRLPRVLLGLTVGASLSVTGVAMQALVRNHLADPFILGVSSGASATATLCMLFGMFSFLGSYALSLSAFFGAAITIVLVFFLARSKGRVNITHLLLSGVAISMFMEAVTKMITLVAPNALGLHNATVWMAGSLAGAKWGHLTLPLVVIIICMVFLMALSRGLNAILLGEETAATLGINPNRLQTCLVLAASLLAGTTIAVSGTIGFIGLMVPHITRILVGADHKRVLPICVFLGGIFLIWADAAARMVIAPEELPVGIITALIGGPFFIWLLKVKKEV